MQQSLGEVIRQVRRFRHLTQRELAGERYSKSYVSGVEHQRITPSAEALRFFAERLGQPDGNFAALLQQPDIAQAMSVLNVPANNGHINRDTTIALLDTLLEQAEFSGFSPPDALPTLAPDRLASLPHQLKSRYYLFMGRSAKKKEDLALALHAFEAALALAPSDLQAAILDEIGTCYFLQRAYHTALGYHLHALHSPLKASSDSNAVFLQVVIELHCGDDYQALGAYHQALAHYESARTHLSVQHDLATTGKVYAGLGYLLYATLSTPTAPPHASTISQGQIEHDYQRANSFLHQGVSFYQASSDRWKEAITRLTQVSLLLDWSAWRQRKMQEQANWTEKQPSEMQCAPLLDEAQEHCRQVLLAWHEPGPNEEAPLFEIDSLLSTAIACLVRIAIQRARLAHLNAHAVHVAYRERAFAAHLCRLLLETLSLPSPLWEAARQALTLSAETLEYRSPSLPPFIDALSKRSESSPHGTPGLVEVYVAAGEVAEELGRVATTPAYTHDCYVQASQYLHASLALAHSLYAKGVCDPGYLVRLYLRWIALLEERALAAPTLTEETTQELLSVLEQAFWQFQCSLQQDINAHDVGVRAKGSC
jgi:tetratricopeptide (TPR) repeat protein